MKTAFLLMTFVARSLVIVLVGWFGFGLLWFANAFGTLSWTIFFFSGLGALFAAAAWPNPRRSKRSKIIYFGLLAYSAVVGLSYRRNMAESLHWNEEFLLAFFAWLVLWMRLWLTDEPDKPQA